MDLLQEVKKKYRTNSANLSRISVLLSLLFIFSSFNATYALTPVPIPITQVVLDDNGTPVTQTASAQGGPSASASNLPVEVVSITINDGGNVIVLDEFASQGFSVQNINIPAPVQNQYFASENGNRVDATTASFDTALESVLGTTDIRDFIPYENNATATSIDILYNFDINGSDDYLLVQERAGNSSFSLDALDISGNPIVGAVTLDFDNTSYPWDTGYDAGDGTHAFDTQNQFFGVIKVSDFNAGATEIRGLRYTNSSGADPKFFAASASPFAAVASIEIIKSIANVVDTNMSSFTDAGDTINYSFVVTNTGGLALNPIMVNDAKIASVSCLATSLAVGANTTCTGSYVIQPPDVIAGGVENTATAIGTPILPGGGSGTPVNDVSDSGTQPDGSPEPTPSTSETPNPLGGINSPSDPTDDPTTLIFSAAPLPGPNPVPTLSEWSLLMLMMLLGWVGYFKGFVRKS